MYRHGDLLLIPIADPIAVGADHDTDLILATGEVSGHAHRVHGWGATSHGRHLSLPRGGQLTHEEHVTITLPPGRYEIIRQRTWTQRGEWRPVED